MGTIIRSQLQIVMTQFSRGMGGQVVSHDVRAAPFIAYAVKDLTHAVFSKQHLSKLIGAILSHTRGQGRDTISDPDNQAARKEEEHHDQIEDWYTFEEICKKQKHIERREDCSRYYRVFCVPIPQMSYLVSKKPSQFFKAVLAKFGIKKSAPMDGNPVAAISAGIVAFVVNHSPHNVRQFDVLGIGAVLQIGKSGFDLIKLALRTAARTQPDIIKEFRDARYRSQEQDERELDAKNKQLVDVRDMERQQVIIVNGRSHRDQSIKQDYKSWSRNHGPRNKPAQINSYVSEYSAHLNVPPLVLVYKTLGEFSMKLGHVPSLFTTNSSIVNVFK
uniref:hypothetical protein n=1 Tax=Pseudovibrio sp. Ad5 TaxID=989436 RepID=UPI001FCB9330|nr:hypothetical protein [Pseudovibrio sp. Ad5]